ncbi:MAG: S41 family peptidase [bacterium]
MSSSLFALILSATVVLLPAESPAPRPKASPPAQAAWNPTSFANVLVGLPKAYYDPSRLSPQRAFVSAMSRLETAVPEVVVDPPDALGWVHIRVRNQARSYSTSDLKDWMQMGDRLLQALRFVDEVLADPTLRDDLQYAAIKGSLSVLDPHTTFYTPEEYRRTRSRFTGSMGGVGLYLYAQAGQILVRSVLPGGPADRAGVRAGDRLLQVDELSMADLNPGIAASRLRGKPGTKVRVRVQRRRRTRWYTIVRQEIVLPSVTTRMLPGRVALITITGFPNNGLAVFTKALAGIRRRRPRAYLLDLRGNEGGYIMQAVRMADFFLDSGTLVKAVGKGGQKVVTWEVKQRKDRIRKPLAVLINRRTASAAEILAGALSVAGRALLLGERTWGKGTVQKLYPLADGSALKLTMWQYLLRGDIPVQTAAIVPDVELVQVTVSQPTRLITASQASGEASQAQHIHALKGKQAWKGRPVIRGVQFVTGRGAGDDPVLELARRGVLAAKASTRAALLQAIRPAVERFRAAHRKLVLERLAARGVDWKPGPAPGAVTLAARLEASPAETSAGQRCVLKLTVTNQSSQAVHQVGAVFQSYHSMIDGRELLVGRIESKKSRTVELPVEVPAGLRERWEQVRVTINAQAQPKAATARTLLHIREQPRLDFRLHWLVDDRQQGNGDGILNDGETAALVVYANNHGKGSSREARVDATDATGGLLITRARAVYPELGPGAVAVARLTVRAPAKPVQGARLGLTLTLYDRTLGGDVSQPVVLPRPGALDKFTPQRAVVAPTTATIHLSGFAGPDAARVARVTTASRLEVEARRGKWLRVRLPGERFAFVGEGDVRSVPDRPSAAGVAAAWRLVPPRITVTPGSSAVDADSLEIRAKAFSRAGMKDVWVRAWNPESKDEEVDKVTYKAAPASGTRELEVTARVRLRPGTNYVAVDGRDASGARGQQRIAVYRPPRKAGAGGGVTSERAVVKAARKSSRKSGCHCRSTTGGDGVWLLLLLLCRVRRRAG